MVGPLKGRAGPGVEDAAAVRAAHVRNPTLLVTPADVDALLGPAFGTVGTFGVDELEKSFEIKILGPSVESLMLLHGSSL